MRRSAILIVALAAALTLAWSFNDAHRCRFRPLEGFEVFRLGSYFFSGALLAVLWPWLGRYAIALGVAGLAASLAARSLLPLETPLTALALAACVVGLGSSGLMAWFGRGGDASYGIYVFAWPVQQFVLLLIAPFWLSLAVAFLVTTAIGYACWHGYERRLMDIPRRLRPARNVPGRRPQNILLRRATAVVGDDPGGLDLPAVLQLPHDHRASGVHSTRLVALFFSRCTAAESGLPRTVPL